MPASHVSLCCFNLKLITEERGEQNTTQARGVELLFHRPTQSSGPLRRRSHTHGPLQAYWASLLSLFPMPREKIYWQVKTGLKRRTAYFPPSFIHAIYSMNYGVLVLARCKGLMERKPECMRPTGHSSTSQRLSESGCTSRLLQKSHDFTDVLCPAIFTAL